ncbi:thioredoxin reductase [Paractinoplanes abujensis]|uniref:Thioredoxin reductase (NADPH) n=1 Tax=Paractinoplanes abujensis TaxID=882441 RepID=A0A7W7CRD8_9ACTN|nr:FAD-dependent oxidoreductase [Actinoplanes abujensis]MBB4693316.1 thioredoxin reductase (NADPH) [Actinoplanes abujensis]GID24517.1 thioredoxin reductase [Actinoplanes abujensis]
MTASEPADDRPAYPALTGSQLTVLARYGSRREMTAGEIIYSPADESNDLVVVLSGEIEVRDESRGRDVAFATFGPGTFVGELNLLTGQRPYVTARASVAGVVVRITPERLRALLDRETEVADVLVAALVARRQLRLADSAERSPIEVIGTPLSEHTLALRTFLSRNTVPYRFTEFDASAATAAGDDLPVVIAADRVLRRATPHMLAAALGLSAAPDDHRPYDVAVVGAGPAGLAAAVYGASEGLRVVVFDATAPGGQAGTSSRIENYLGFPDGISGADLTSRATIQAQRFGARISSPSRIAAIEPGPTGFVLTLTDGSRALARAVVVAAGAEYRRLPLDNWDRFEGAGIYFAATELEAGLCAGAEAVVLGGGNSAGQAALHLARRCTRVTIVIRRNALTESMSHYLIDRIMAHDSIDVASSTVIGAVLGGDRLEKVELHDTRSGEKRLVGARGLFCFIGADPGTAWMPERVRRDDHGFVLTDADLPESPGRRRLRYETSLDGVFAAGDVRLGSMKRVAAAVGEGSSVIRSVHHYLELQSSAGEG